MGFDYVPLACAAAAVVIALWPSTGTTAAVNAHMHNANEKNNANTPACAAYQLQHDGCTVDTVDPGTGGYCGTVTSAYNGSVGGALGERWGYESSTISTHSVGTGAAALVLCARQCGVSLSWQPPLQPPLANPL